MSLKRYHIFGERCSGTNFLDHSLKQNFEAFDVFHDTKIRLSERYRKYGNPHWFSDYLDLSYTDDILFICIVRDPIKWLNSFYNRPRNISVSMKQSTQKRFLFGKFSGGCYCYNYEMPYELQNSAFDDLTFYNRENYDNIFELRYEKIEWMYRDLPELVKNYIFIRYEDLISDFQGTMKKIHDAGLLKKDNIKEDIEEMKKWMKRDGYKNVEETTFEFAQKDPEIKLQPSFGTRKEYEALIFSIEDYPKQYTYYEKKMGYYN